MSIAWNELLPLPETVASRRYLDGLNLRAVRWLVSIGTVGAIVPSLVLLGERLYTTALVMLVLLAANLVLLLMRERPVFRRNIGLFLLAYAVVCVLVLSATATEPMLVWGFTTFALAPVFLIGLRWRESLLWTLTGVFLMAAAWAVVRGDVETPELAPLIVGSIFIAGIALIGRRVTRRRLEGFRAEHRRQGSIERERTRMRDELDDARIVQLSMLPQQAPDLSWLDVASVSVPATEVGGDYYDYFVLDDDRVAVVIGDVSGHGMSSGLVLAAVRGGLHLLRRDLDRPVEVLGRLDVMLRATTPGRMFVTLLIAVIDRARHEIVVANAGHPQALVRGETGVESLGGPGRPLGTRLEGDFGEHKMPFRPGDVLVLYTDGATELSNFRGDPFGAERLEKELLRRRADHGARALRDELLSSLTHFRSDVEQADDITLVVVGLEPGGGA